MYHTIFANIELKKIKIMKKSILAFAVLAASFPIFLTSCDKDDDDSGVMCTCIEEYDDGKNWEKNQAVLDATSFGATNCYDLAIKLRLATQSDYYYDCW